MKLDQGRQQGQSDVVLTVVLVIGVARIYVSDFGGQRCVIRSNSALRDLLCASAGDGFDGQRPIGKAERFVACCG